MAYSPSDFVIPSTAIQPLSNTTMSSAQAQDVYNHAGYQDSSEAEDNFAQQYDLDNPEKAKSSYMKYVVSHPLFK